MKVLYYFLLNRLILWYKIDEAELISLYDENDSVVELTTSNITTIYDPNKVWFVEFYAHWCGHCQRFSAIWKQLAEEFDGEY